MTPTDMEAEPPPRADRHGRSGRRTRRALWLAGAGVVAGLAIAIASALGDISMHLTIALGLPAAVLTVGGFISALPSDPEAAERQGFRAGWKAGSLRGRWRSVFGRHGKGRP